MRTVWILISITIFLINFTPASIAQPEGDAVSMFQRLIASFENLLPAKNQQCVDGSPKPCQTDWNKSYADYKHGYDQYKTSIEDAMESLLKPRLPSGISSLNDYCTKNFPVHNDMPPWETRAQVLAVDVETRGIFGNADLESRFAKMTYKKVKARKESKGTIILTPGGPGAIFSESPDYELQQENYDVIVFDDLGMGNNSFELKPGDEKYLTLDYQAKIMERIIQQEKLKDYVLQGGSFSTVSATVAGSYLSQTENPPKAVVLSGVVNKHVTVERETSKSLNPFGRPKEIKGKTCWLAVEDVCHDDHALALINPPARRELISARMQAFYHQGDVTNLQDPWLALKKAFRNLFHWEIQRTPKDAANALEKFFGDEAKGYLPLACWYKETFSKIKFLNTYGSPSHMATTEAHRCFFSKTPEQGPDSDKSCDCFPLRYKYDPGQYQIGGETKLFYVNGDQDSQTPYPMAEAHFQSQKSPNKALLKVCGGGHNALAAVASHERRTVSFDIVMGFAFAGDLKSFQGIDGYCNP